MSVLSTPAHTSPRSTTVACSHCSLPVPADRRREAGPSYCCNGCETVAHLLQQHDLDDYYRLRNSTGAEPQAVGEQAAGDYIALDHPAYHDAHVRVDANGQHNTELVVDGMHCAACVWLLENLHRIHAGVTARVNYGRKTVRLHWDGTHKLSTLAQTLQRLGYPPRTDARSQPERSDRTLLIQMAVAAVCAGNGMLLAFALYAGLFDQMANEFVQLFRWSSMFFGWIALLGPGQVFLRSAWAALRTGTAHLDIPVALGLLAGGIAGTIHTILGTGEVYFDSVTMLVFLLLVGRWVQRYQQRWVARSMDLLLAMTPQTTTRLGADDREESVPIEALQPGDRIRLPAGSVSPVDGEIVAGQSEVDLSLLTGESMPSAITAGEGILAGSQNLLSTLTVRVQKCGYETRLGQLLQLVEQLQQRDSDWVRRADRLAHVFVLSVLGLALVTLGLWASTGLGLAVGHAVALVIVACPCALSLATPLTVAVAMARAARAGVLVKGGDALEQLSHPGLLLFDKTGTLTLREPQLVAWHGDDRLRDAIVAIEALASHPLATAWVQAWRDDTRVQPTVRDFSQRPGGVEAVVNGQRFVIGQPSFVQEACAVTLPVTDSDDAGSVAYVACDGAFVGKAVFRDPLRPEAGEIVQRLRKLGWEIGIASGDAEAPVREAAELLGIAPQRTWWRQSPEDKLHLVEQHVADRTVVMIGDGINDAAALSRATVGIAVAGGAEASMLAADVYLRHAGLREIEALLVGARRCTRAVLTGLGVSLGYNVIAVSMAVAGQITPLVAAVLMPVSSLSVLALATLSPTFRMRKERSCP